MFGEFRSSSCSYLTAFYNNTPPHVPRHVLEEGCEDNGVRCGGDGELKDSRDKEQRSRPSGRLREEASLFSVIFQCHHQANRCVCVVLYVCVSVCDSTSFCRVNPSGVTSIQPSQSDVFLRYTHLFAALSDRVILFRLCSGFFVEKNTTESIVIIMFGAITHFTDCEKRRN